MGVRDGVLAAKLLGCSDSQLVFGNLARTARFTSWHQGAFTARTGIIDRLGHSLARPNPLAITSSRIDLESAELTLQFVLLRVISILEFEILRAALRALVFRSGCAVRCGGRSLGRS